MPKYRVNTKSFVNNSLYDEGATIDYDGVPGLNLDPLDDAAIQAYETAGLTRDKRGLSVPDLTRQKVAVLGGNPEAIDLAQAASVAAQAAQAALTGHVVSVDGKVIDAPQQPAPVGAAGLV